MKPITLTIEIRFETDDTDAAYRAAEHFVKTIEEYEIVEMVNVLSGVADE